MKNFIAICLLLIPAFVTAQNITVRGTVKDKQNGENIFGASIYVEGTTIGSMTNEYGFYSITLPKGENTIIVSFVGYKTIYKQINGEANITLNFEAEPESTQLSEVVIDGGKSKKVNIRSPQMGVSKLQIKEIEKIPVVLGEPDILKSIQSLPGVTNGGEGSSGFNVRGGAADQNLVLLDEATIYNTAHLLGFVSIFNSDAIKDVKLYKGSIPAEFGGRVSSVLDVRQKDGNSKRFTINGGIGIVSSKLTMETPMFNKKGSMLLAGRASYAHLLVTGDNKASFYDVNFKTNYELNENNRLYLSSYIGRDYFNTNFVATDYGNTIANLRWNHIFNDKLFSNLSFIYSNYDYSILLNGIDLDWKAYIENVNIRYDFKYYLSERFKFNFGFNSALHDFNPGEIKPLTDTSPINPLKLDRKNALENALYFDVNQTLTDRFRISYGVRFSSFHRFHTEDLNVYKDGLAVVYNELLEKYQRGQVIGKTSSMKSYYNFEPRLALSYELNEGSSVKASYARTAQYLHLLSNTTTINPVDVWAPSGNFVKPQMSNQYAVGYFRNFLDNDYSLEVEAYYKTIDNRIDYIDGSDLIGNNNIETEILNGHMRSCGVEFLLRKNTGSFQGWLAYTLSKSEQQTLGGAAGGPGINNGEWYNVNFDRPHDFSLTGTYKLNEKWTFGGNLVYQTGRPLTVPNGQYNYLGMSIAAYGDRNSSRLPDYHRLDISATYTPRIDPNRRWRGEWKFGIYNVYNRNNAQDISFGQNASTGSNEATKTSIFGLVPSVSYNFKF